MTLSELSPVANGEMTVEGVCKELKCVFFVKFHTKLGPQIVHQEPNAFISDDVFKSFEYNYICPKPSMCHKLIKFGFEDESIGYVRVVGYPVWIEDHVKYAATRGVSRFNLCFVFDYKEDDTPYEYLIRKVSLGIRRSEQEYNLVHNFDEAVIKHFVSKIFRDLKKNGACFLELNDGQTLIPLKVIPKKQPEVNILRSHIPTLLYSLDELSKISWDLISSLVIPKLNGVRCVSEVIKLVHADPDLVLCCLRNLLTLKKITLLPMFRLSNSYLLTSAFSDFTKNTALQNDCLNFVSTDENMTVHAVFAAYSLLSNGHSLRSVLQYCDESIDIRKLVQFGVQKGFLRRLSKYPYLPRSSLAAIEVPLRLLNSELPNGSGSTNNMASIETSHLSSTETSHSAQTVQMKLLDDVKKLLDGSMDTEELACLLDVDVYALENLIQSIPNVVLYTK